MATAKKRADHGKPIDFVIDKQPAEIKAIAMQLRALIESAAPKATSSLKWGMPFFMLEGKMMVAIGIHKKHVNLILPGAPGTFDDPKGLLEGEGKTGQHLKITNVKELPKTEVKKWLAVAVKNAKAK
jgi:uncharacterized protein YdhG (YjbR/CyaY superfamily)